MYRQIAFGMMMCMGCAASFGQDRDTIKVDRMEALKEIVVKGDLPNTRLKGNAMITRVQGTPLASTGTLAEMFVKVPGMTGSEDSPEVIGKGTPLIYVNGRLVRDDSELKRLRSEDVRDVEVINNPGAKYDATVRAVVRIRTKKLQGEGFGLDLSFLDSQDLRYGMNTPNTKLGMNYRKDGVDVFGSVWYSRLNFHQYSTLEETTYTSKVFHQNGPYTMTWKNNQIVYTLGTNWQIDANNSVGVRANVTHYLNGTDMVIYDEDVEENGVLVDHLYSEQTSRNSQPLGWLTNTYYNGKAGKLGIDFNFDFMKNGLDTDRENLETSLVNSDFIRSKSGTDSHLYAAKLVLAYPVWKGDVSAGTEMTFVNRHNTYSIDKSFIADTDADIDENNIAAFAEYECDFDKAGTASVGMRYEHTLFDYDDCLNNDKLHRSMDEFFPTASYSVSLSKVQTALSYSIKTQRPDFFAMDDAVTYISRYSQQAGNSTLLNERIHDLTLNVSWRWITFSASYEKCKHAITQWSFLADNDAVLIKHVNLDRPINTLEAYIMATPHVGVWSLNATAGVEKQDLYLDLEDFRVPGGIRRAYFDKPRYILNLYNTFSLKHSWRVGLDFAFRSHGYSHNFYNNYDNYRLAMLIQKSFLKDKSLTLRASVSDILQRNRANEFGDMGNYTIQQNNRYTRHKLLLAAFYRFNSTRSKYKGTGAGTDAQKRMNR